MRNCLAIYILLLVTVSALTAQEQAIDSLVNKSANAFLVNHCSNCHADGADEGGFDMDVLTGELDDKANFSQWERVYDRVQVGEMPPKDADQPNSDSRSNFLAQLKTQLRTAHAQQKGTILRRLNRREYENTLNDLFGTELKLAELLPEDARSHEFDNVGSALGISMVHLRKYMEAAELVLDEAIAKTTKQPEVLTIIGDYASSREGEQFIGKKWKKLKDGAVVRFSGGGYPSGMIRTTNVRVPGRYKVKVTGYAYQSDKPITFSVGGTTFKRGAEKPTYGFWAFKSGEPQSIEFTVKIESNYMVQIEPYGINDPQRYKRSSIDEYDGPGLAIKSVELTGPLLDQFPSRGHQMIFKDIERVEVEPRNPRDKQKPWYKPTFEIKSSDEENDVAKALKRVAAFAFRKPVTNEQIAPYVELFKTQREKGGSFEDSLRLSVAAIFCSPNFLYLKEPAGKLDDFAIASRLSYFLSRTTPDKQLLSLAFQRKLSDPEIIKAETERLLNGPRFERFITDFSDAWLNLRELDFTIPDNQLFPEFDQYLRYSMPLETHGFLQELVQSNLPVKNLIHSDFAMLNDRLAKHYGIPGVEGSRIRKVILPSGHVRGGLLTQSSIMKVTSNGTNTSPVVRGVFVMERILGEKTLPPPPGVPGVEPDIRGATTLREQLDKHRSLANCNSCHRQIDPPGFALESFNPIGGFRENYRSIGEGERIDLEINGRKVRYRIGPTVDASGELFNRKPFQNFVEFRSQIAKDEDRIAKAFTEKLLTFATGRELGFSDRDEVESIVKASAKSNHRVRDLIHLIIASDIFQTK